MLGRLSITGAVILLLVGCGSGGSDIPAEKSQPAVATIPTVEVPVSDWLTVITNPAELQSARTLAERIQQEQSEAVLAHVDETYIGFDELRLLESRRSDTVARLRSMIGDKKVSPQSISAAVLLCRLGEMDALSHFIAAVRTGSPSQRIKAMGEINFSLDEIPEVRNNRDLQLALLNQLDDPDENVVKAAIQANGMLLNPGAADKFVDLLRKPDTPTPGRLCYWIAQLAPTQQNLQVVIAAMNDESKDLDRWGAIALADFADADDQETRRLAAAQLRKIIDERLTKLSQLERFSAERSQLEESIDALVKLATDDDTDRLKSLLNAQLSNSRKGQVLQALVQLEGNAGHKRLFAAIGQPDLRSYAAAAFGELYASSADQAAISALLKAADEEQSPYAVATIARALQRIGGDGKAEALRLAEKVDPGSKQSILWAAKNWTAESVMSDVVATGIIDGDTYQTALQQIKAGEYYDPEQPVRIEDVLFQAKRGIAFDVETDMLPCRHDLLVQQFAEATNGAFRPSATSEQWLQRDKQDHKAEYTLQFINDDRLYRARLRNFGDWYDVERVVTAINRALTDSSSTGRFVALSTDGQMAHFLFGSPNVISTLAQKFHMPLDKNLNRAMQSGKEFEQKVLEDLKRRE